jgi:hypothetical protein
MARTGEQELEIAAALDRAIEYEDALPETVGPDRSRMIMDERRVEALVGDTDLQELLAACRAYEAARDRVRAACARVAGAGPAAAAGDGPGLDQVHSGRRAAAKRRACKARIARVPADPGQIDKPWQKCKCSRCGSITGSRIVDDQRYPTGHYMPGTQTVCPGRGQVAELATAEEIGDAKNPGE